MSKYTKLTAALKAITIDACQIKSKQIIIKKSDGEEKDLESVIETTTGLDSTLSELTDALINHIGDDTHLTTEQKDAIDSYLSHVGDDTHLTTNDRTLLNNLTSEIIPGEIKWFSGSLLPSGFLLCNGATISRTTYSTLFAAIGTTWGNGNGSTTFTLPNLINRVAWGGTTAGTYKSAGLPNITGGAIGDITGRGTTKTSGALTLTRGADDIVSGRGSEWYNLTLSFNAKNSNAIYGASTTVQPPAAILLPIIKY